MSVITAKVDGCINPLIVTLPGMNKGMSKALAHAKFSWMETLGTK